ncbi:putative mediator of RNA polymerase II transcription subunit 26 [Osmia bicornis bicornis]|uniref:putative mediator of RNA polymerase II transcription subunit 26 n=1 Tax=Osmia bicornis bicornis TaxID=1437191 RepID=UPI0010F63043|nr:putative mediator of RNA polymerase II transcription subunit 26 [Osmia bicornis bicornis]
MRLPILLIALISTVVAQENAQRSVRTPQAQIRYQDPNGLKVDWKLFSPQTQLRSQYQNLQISQQEQSSTSTHAAQAHPQQQAQRRPQQSQLLEIDPDEVQYKSYSQPQAQAAAQQEPSQIQYKTYEQPQVQAPDQNQIHYNTYSNARSHAKQVVLENYKPQRHYAEQPTQQYSSNVIAPQDQQSTNADYSQYDQSESYEQIEQQKSRRDYANSGFQGRIVYKHELEQQQQQQQQEQYEQQIDHVKVPIENLPVPPPQKLIFHKNMPREIQELLQFQAELPYNVIANSISYKPKTVFVPKPLPPETKGPYSYRSKIYYVNNDRYEPDFESIKPVEEEQNH